MANLEQWQAEAKNASFEERLFWETDNPPPPIILKCANCASVEEFHVSWKEIERSVAMSTGIEIIRRECPQCSDDDGED